MSPPALADALAIVGKNRITVGRLSYVQLVSDQGFSRPTEVRTVIWIVALSEKGILLPLHRRTADGLPCPHEGGASPPSCARWIIAPRILYSEVLCRDVCSIKTTH